MRRCVLVLVVLALALAGVGAATSAAAADVDRPHHGFAPSWTVLREAAPESVGLDSAPIRAAEQEVRAHESPPVGSTPMYAGAVALMGHRGRIVAVHVSGHALRYRTGTEELPREQWVPMRRNTVFDLASVSKLFTSIVAVQLVEEGRLELDAPVTTYLPEFAANGKQEVTVRQLLTHTSGFTAWLPLWRAPDNAARVRAVMQQPLTDPPGTVYRYSDLNLITLALIVEKLRGRPLDVVVRERVTEPLGMHDTGYNPADRERTAATEYQTQPPRGLVWGEVHDENAWSLGGVAGHAGVFSTADDLAVLAQALLNGGSYRGRRILARSSVEQLVTDLNGAFPGHAHGLGFELDQAWYMDGLTGPRTAGHTGYTGTSLVVDLDSRSFAVLLTNRVHPSRTWGSVNPARREWARGLARAMPVHSRRMGWQSVGADASTATLQAPVNVTGGSARLDAEVFAHIVPGDRLVLERTSDGSAWEPVPMTLRRRVETAPGTLSGTDSRDWDHVAATLPVSTTAIRWSYLTDADTLGRGVAVAGVRVVGHGGVLLDSRRDADRFVGTGWVRLPDRSR